MSFETHPDQPEWLKALIEQTHEDIVNNQDIGPDNVLVRGVNKAGHWKPEVLIGGGMGIMD